MQPPPKSAPRPDAQATAPDVPADDAPTLLPLRAGAPATAEGTDTSTPHGARGPHALPQAGAAPTAADEDRTLFASPLGDAPRTPAPDGEAVQGEADEDRTLFAHTGGAALHTPAPDGEAVQGGADEDRTVFAHTAGATPHRPAPGGSAANGETDEDRTLFTDSATAPHRPAPDGAPAQGEPDDDRTLFGTPGGGDHGAGAQAGADDAPTVFLSQDDIPTLRMPAPAGAAVPGGDTALHALPTGSGGSGLTLRMPAPGGRAGAARARAEPAHAAPTAAGARAPRAGVELQRLVAGVNPLLGAASVLLALVAQLRATSAHADPPGLRRQLLAHVADFEAQAAASGVARPRITAARYLLCTFLDEVIAATPWGQGRWEAHTLLGEFHEERLGGVKAFELLEKLGEDPAANAEVLELFYVCLALGFEGRWRGQPDGRARLEAIAERVLQSVRPATLQPQLQPRSLSLRWQGVLAPQRPGLHLPPLWSVAVLAAALVLAALLVLQQRLAAQARPLLRELHALPAALQPQRAAAAQTAPAPAGRLAPLLQADAAAGALTVRDERLRSVLTLPADALFKSGSAELQPGAAALLGRIAQALRAVPGQVDVIGHGDEGGGTSLRYPSAWHLTRERALAVMNELSRLGVPSTRLHAEGRGDAEPLAAGPAATDRARNRRVEIELRLPRPQE